MIITKQASDKVRSNDLGGVNNALGLYSTPNVGWSLSLHEVPEEQVSQTLSMFTTIYINDKGVS